MFSHVFPLRTLQRGLIAEAVDRVFSSSLCGACHVQIEFLHKTVWTHIIATHTVWHQHSIVFNDSYCGLGSTGLRPCCMQVLKSLTMHWTQFPQCFKKNWISSWTMTAMSGWINVGLPVQPSPSIQRLSSSSRAGSVFWRGAAVVDGGRSSKQSCKESSVLGVWGL